MLTVESRWQVYGCSLYSSFSIYTFHNNSLKNICGCTLSLSFLAGFPRVLHSFIQQANTYRTPIVCQTLCSVRQLQRWKDSSHSSAQSLVEEISMHNENVHGERSAEGYEAQREWVGNSAEGGVKGMKGIAEKVLLSWRRGHNQNCYNTGKRI
jgi:hypothetical protein